jgi:hypothetical protein
MTTERAGHSITLLSTGKVLITGGASSYSENDQEFFGFNTSAELFDPSSATFALTLGMTVARYDAAATLLPGGRVLISGGLSNTGRNAQDYLSSSELFW